jgi:hypothetical protein
MNIKQTVTYDHRLKRTGHPVRSAIHKLQVPLAITLNRANRHSVEFKLLAALKGEAKGERGERGEHNVAEQRISRHFRVRPEF